MSAERDKAILIGVGIFVIGFVSGAGSLIWVLNRDVKEKNPEVVDAEETEKPAGSKNKSKKKAEAA